MRYAREHHFPNPTFFVDDGVSGVTYDRSGFQAMLAEIEAEVALFLGHGVREQNNWHRRIVPPLIVLPTQKIIQQIYGKSLRIQDDTACLIDHTHDGGMIQCFQ